MSEEKPQAASEGGIGQSASTGGLATPLPWHVGFHNEIADRIIPGSWQHEMVQYKAVNVCASNGRHVAWACSQAHAELIVEAVNRMANVELTGSRAGSSPVSPATEGSEVERRVGGAP